MDTMGSSFDTVLAVYTGTVLSNLTRLASNDDLDAQTLQSRVTFGATAGQTYQIAVDGYNSASAGAIVFRLNLPNPFPVILTPPQS